MYAKISIRPHRNSALTVTWAGREFIQERPSRKLGDFQVGNLRDCGKHRRLEVHHINFMAQSQVAHASSLFQVCPSQRRIAFQVPAIHERLKGFAGEEQYCPVIPAAVPLSEISSA